MFADQLGNLAHLQARDTRLSWYPAARRSTCSAFVSRWAFVKARGDEALNLGWNFLDITPYGRQEDWEDSPEGWPQSRVGTGFRYGDEYDEPS